MVEGDEKLLRLIVFSKMQVYQVIMSVRFCLALLSFVLFPSKSFEAFASSDLATKISST